MGNGVNMVARVGRWRRSYDPDGEEALLGWGEERFVDAVEEAASLAGDGDNADNEDVTGIPCTEWSPCEIDCSLTDPDVKDPQVIAKARGLPPLLEEWQKLASDVATYENTDVTAMTRVMRGQPGLRVDPAALVRSVLQDIGPCPSVEDADFFDPTDFAIWGAALINPLPSLGVSPEVRGRILEAPDAMSRLQILEWGVTRSIANLKGSAPL